VPFLLSGSALAGRFALQRGITSLLGVLAVLVAALFGAGGAFFTYAWGRILLWVPSVAEPCYALELDEAEGAGGVGGALTSGANAAVAAAASHRRRRRRRVLEPPPAGGAASDAVGGAASGRGLLDPFLIPLGCARPRATPASRTAWEMDVTAPEATRARVTLRVEYSDRLGNHIFQ
jgi:hypothetical protein